MAKTDHIYPSKEAVYKMYKFLVTYEQEVSKGVGKYDFSSDELNDFLENQEIMLKPVSRAKYVSNHSRNNYIVYVCGDHKGKYDDKVHDLLRHIRNAIAHGLITKTAVNKTCFKLTDRNQNKSITMQGSIDESLFFALIVQLIKTKKKIV